MALLIGICGSLRRDSFNLKLLRAAVELAPAGTTIDIVPIHASRSTTATSRPNTACHPPFST